MACTQGVVFDLNLIENSALEDGLSGWAPVGACTALSVGEEEPAKVPTETIDDVAEEYRPSGQYILASGRANEADGLRRAIAAAAQEAGTGGGNFTEPARKPSSHARTVIGDG